MQNEISLLLLLFRSFFFLHKTMVIKKVFFILATTYILISPTLPNQIIKTFDKKQARKEFEREIITNDLSRLKSGSI